MRLYSVPASFRCESKIGFTENIEALRDAAYGHELNREKICETGAIMACFVQSGMLEERLSPPARTIV
jgi:hypothetical protein